jgi:DNA-binding winged helix-turn-helix (wHTH) protein/TolB-like protein/tetratricopeptide (TPR) repeat protein
MKSGTPARPGLRRFGVFELDESSSELRRNGTLIHLPPQPLQILKLLIGNAGEVVDRERIRREVWGATAVDFDRSLNVAVAQIRSALNDDAASPRFVQTLPRRGYRFVAEVDAGGSTAAPPAARPVRRFAIAIAGGAILVASLAAGAFRLRLVSDSPIRIAVLPFEELSLDAGQAARSAGLFDDLLTDLGGIQPARVEVVGRRSVLGVNARGPGSLRKLGKLLNVNYVLESSVRPDGNSLRVSARLIDTGSEAVRWSAAFAQDGPASNFEESVVGRVSAGVLTTLFPGASPSGPATVCRDGRDAFETGRMLVNRGGLRDLERSLAFFQQAGCAQARAETAEILVRLARIRKPSPDSWEGARAAAQTALKADANLAAAHLALGNIAFWHDWNWPAAEREFREALGINPSNPDAHHDLAWLQVALGMRANAMSSLETAIAIDPFSARTRMDSAWLLLQMGQYNRAGSEARRALGLDPGMNEARFCLSRALLYAGDVPSALEALKPLMPQALAAEFAAVPSTDAVRRLIEFQTGDATTDPYQRAWRLAWLHLPTEALTALEEGLARRSMMMPLIAADPAFQAIRNEARFRAIAGAMRLRI